MLELVPDKYKIKEIYERASLEKYETVECFPDWYKT